MNWMEIYVLRPENFDEIIAKTAGHEKPYTKEQLQKLYSDSLAQNKVFQISILNPNWWEANPDDVPTTHP